MADFMDMNATLDNSLAELDPSVADGYRVIYDREVPFELRLQEVSERTCLCVIAKHLVHTVCVLVHTLCVCPPNPPTPTVADTLSLAYSFALVEQHATTGGHS